MRLSEIDAPLKGFVQIRGSFHGNDRGGDEDTDYARDLRDELKNLIHLPEDASSIPQVLRLNYRVKYSETEYCVGFAAFFFTTAHIQVSNSKWVRYICEIDRRQFDHVEGALHLNYVILL